MANYDLTYEGSRVQGILDTGNSLKDAGYIFRGEATPSTVPGTPTERVAYIGGPGTYTNFGSSITVPVGRICVFKYTGSAWSNQVIDTKVSDGAAYKGIATPTTNPGSPIGSEFYIAVQAGTYTNFGGLTVTAGINILKYNGSTWSVQQAIAIDAEPTQGSDHLVKSGGVLGSIIQNGPAFDLSAYNAQGGVLATYADLSAALTALNALPADFKKGGMSIKFVQSSDNKYVQFRLMAQSFTTDTSKWQGVDDEPTAGSDNLVKSGGAKTSVDIVQKMSENNSVAINGGRIIGKYIYPTFRAEVPDYVFWLPVDGDYIKAGSGIICYIQCDDFVDGNYTLYCYEEIGGAAMATTQLQVSNKIGAFNLTSDAINYIRVSLGGTYTKKSILKVLSRTRTTGTEEKITTINNSIADINNNKVLGEFLPSSNYWGYICNPDNGAISSATSDADAFLIKVKGLNYYELKNIVCLWGNNRISCYNDIPTSSNYLQTYLGNATLKDNNIIYTLENTEYIVLTVLKNSYSGNGCIIWYTDMAEIDSRIKDINENKVLGCFLPISNYFGYVCNPDTGGIMAASSVINGFLIKVKASENYQLHNIICWWGNNRISCYNGIPTASNYHQTFLGSAKWIDSNTIETLPNTQYILLTFGVENYNGKGILLWKMRNVTENYDKIVCWGDSLTAGAQGGSSVRYPSVLQSLVGTNYLVVNAGVGGENTNSIMCRIGTKQLFLKGANADNIVIPSNGSNVAVRVFYIDVDGTVKSPVLFDQLVQGFPQIETIYVEGIKCSFTKTNGVYYIAAKDTLESDYTTSDNPDIITYAQKELRNVEVAVIWMGTNGGWDWNPDTLITQLNQCVDFIKPKNFLIIGLHAPIEQIVAIRTTLEAKMGHEYSVKYVNVRKYLTTEALKDANITPTAEDEAAIANGNCPPSLLVDETHLNATGYTVVANYIYQRMKLLDMIN